MAKTERVRHTLNGEFDPAEVQRMTQQGWRPVALEWERETEGVAEVTPISPGAALQEVPYGLRVAGDCHHLEEDTAEMQALQTLAELIVQDAPLSRMAQELNDRGFRMRDGGKWTPLRIYALFPRLIETTPKIFSEDQWKARRPNMALISWNS